VKGDWLERRLGEGWSEIPPPRPPREFVNGETFHFLGRQHRLRICSGAAEDRVQLEGEFLQVAARSRRALPRVEIRARLISWFAQQAQDFLAKRVERWTPKVGSRQKLRVLIASQSRRWASCGKGGVLRFNWRLMSAPVSLIDYVVVHELCHLRHPNHSPAFWAELTRLMPDRMVREAKLGAVGRSLGF
jgi:predicted metal-dependent hydrolase